MSLWLLLVALVVAAFGVVWVLRACSRHASRLLEDEQEGADPVAHFRGGLRWPLGGWLGTTTTPAALVNLDLYEWGVRVAATRPAVRALSPTWSATYDELWAAEIVRRPGRRHRRREAGVRLRGDLPGSPLVFLTSRASALADALEARGVTVVREPVTLRSWSNG